MKIFDIFKKRKPNHLIIFVNYKRREFFLYKWVSKLTYSIGPYSDLERIKEDIQKFIKKYPEPLKQINISSFGKGFNLVELNEGKEKIQELVDTLKPIINQETRLMFTTCFSGIVYKNAVEMSEYLGGIEICAMTKSYELNGKMTRCKCKEKGYSKKILNKIPKSLRGFGYDEHEMLEIVKFNVDKKINWETSGMAYEYNKIALNDNVCYEGEQPYNLIKSIRNYLFNIQ